MDGKCTLYFDDPYWVAVFERSDENGVSAARYVFGGEPSEAEFQQFVIERLQELSFSKTSSAGLDEKQEVGYKRRQRLARHEMEQTGISTYAQRMVQSEYERLKQARQAESHQEKIEIEQHKFMLKHENKKEKHRGH